MQDSNIAEETPSNNFQLLRLSGPDKTEAQLYRILEDSFRMIFMKNNTLISCSNEVVSAVWQWEVTEDSVHPVRCILTSEEISDLKSFEDGFHFLTVEDCFGDINTRLVSIYSIETCTPMYKLSLNINLSVLPISINHILSRDSLLNHPCKVYIYSTRRSGHKYLMTSLNGSACNSAKKLFGVDNVVVFLYPNSLDFWNITEEKSVLVSHYEFRIIEEAFGMTVTTNNYIIVSTQNLGIEKNFLLHLKNLNIVSETLITSNAFGFRLYHNISSSIIMCLNKVKSQLTDHGHIEYFVFQNLSKNLSKDVATLSKDGIFSLFSFFFPDLGCIIIFTMCGKFYRSKINQELVRKIKYGELIKNARTISQAHRTLSGDFKTIPVEICLKIISLTDLSIPEEKARNIASLYFCKPSQNPTLDHVT